MRIYGHTGHGKNTCVPRKRTKPTKAEKALKKRQDAHLAILQRNKSMKGQGPMYSGYRRPGSLQVS